MSDDTTALMTAALAAPPLNPRAAERRGAILDVAWKVFLEQGYGAASMSDIAARLGGSKGTLYNYFSSKEELFLAVVQQRSDQLYAELQAPARRSGEIARDLEDFGTRLLGVILSERHVAFSRLVIAEAGRIPVGARFDSRREHVLGPLAARIAEAMAEGRLREADPLQAGEDLWNLCSATMQRRALMGTAPALSAEAIGELAARAVQVFLAAYAAPNK